MKEGDRQDLALADDLDGQTLVNGGREDAETATRAATRIRQMVHAEHIRNPGGSGWTDPGPHPFPAECPECLDVYVKHLQEFNGNRLRNNMEPVFAQHDGPDVRTLGVAAEDVIP